MNINIYGLILCVFRFWTQVEKKRDCRKTFSSNPEYPFKLVMLINMLWNCVCTSPLTCYLKIKTIKILQFTTFRMLSFFSPSSSKEVSYSVVRYMKPVFITKNRHKASVRNTALFKMYYPIFKQQTLDNTQP